ncbi:putative fucosyltransferase 8 isoform X1 [Senna tora]|uniref:Putative fucosyltransferase 8 isoform X1 n=1 Tax=Senna tora TaxID=362788 RepID=A0A834XF17_9FABA|nr:putative fucosyltransferase 8 isoform X1 [Senna tora]
MAKELNTESFDHQSKGINKVERERKRIPKPKPESMYRRRRLTKKWERRKERDAAFPILILLLHQNSISYLVEGFPKINILSGIITQNSATDDHVLRGAQNVSAQPIGEEGQDVGVGPKHQKEVVDGVVASTFEEGSCISRHQSHLYRKASPYKPSSYLKSKLRDYEDLHRTCKFHYKTMKNNDTKSSNKSDDDDGARNCKYLIWTSFDGLGNRMVSLASAFLYAILTHRVLLVKFQTDMNGLFCEPFPDSSWLLPKDFPHWEDQNQNQSSFRVLHLRHTNNEHYDFFHCVHTQQLLQKIPVLILESNQYFVPLLFSIPSFRKHLIKMFPVKDTIFHHIGHYLFHPSNEAWHFITKFYQAHLANVNEKIGLQIRVFDTERKPHQAILNKILSCSFKHKLLPVLSSPLKNHTSKAIFIASLYSEYREKLRSMYMANTSVESNEVIGVYQASHEEYQNSNDNKHNMKAWSEIYLLSLCDELVTTSFSSFGYVAQSLGGLKPWILKWSYGEQPVNPPCEEAMSMEPCFHYPPKHDCRNNSIVNVTSFFHYTRHCEDFGNGVKLVNVNDKIGRLSTALTVVEFAVMASCFYVTAYGFIKVTQALNQLSPPPADGDNDDAKKARNIHRQFRILSGIYCVDSDPSSLQQPPRFMEKAWLQNALVIPTFIFAMLKIYKGFQSRKALEEDEEESTGSSLDDLVPERI